MKKLLCVILTVVMLCSCTVSAFAAGGCDCDATPVVVVRGFGSALYETLDDQTLKCVFPPQGEDITSAVPDIASTLVGLTISKDYDAVADGIISILDKLMGSLRCDENGDSVKELKVIDSSPTDVDTHKNTNYSFNCEIDEQTGDYIFEYDWRLDPNDIADELNSYIGQVKSVTGHDKVVLCAHSEGNSVAAAYLNKYGNADVEKAVFLCAAFNGLKLVGKIFTRDLSVENKMDELEDFLLTFLGTDPAGAIVTSLVSILNDMGVLDKVNDELVKLLDAKLEDVYDEYLIDMFGAMPGLWSFVPDEYYETAKTKMFAGNTKYDALIDRLDEYHYGVQCKVESILTSLKDDGIPVVVVCGYGISPIPVYENSDEQCDMLIDTKYTSIGATCAKVGEVLEESDSPYLSPDLLVDASTCLFPDSTWFVKYQDHNDYCKAYRDFVTWTITYDGQPTVFTDEAYSQFLICENHERLVPVTAEDDVHSDKSDIVIILLAIIALIKKAISSLGAYLPIAKAE